MLVAASICWLTRPAVLEAIKKLKEKSSNKKKKQKFGQTTGTKNRLVVGLFCFSGLELVAQTERTYSTPIMLLGGKIDVC